MAPDLDMRMGVGMGMGMGMMPMSMVGMEATPSAFSTAYLCGLPTSDAMRVDDLLDFSNKDELLFDAAVTVSAAAENHHQHGHRLPMHEPSAGGGGSFDSSGYNLSSLSDDFYMPSEDVAELEWLSKFVDESFSDVPFSSSLGGCADGAEGTGVPPPSKYNVLRAEYSSSIPARARSKRSRAPATALHHNAANSWSSPPPPHSPPFAASPTSPSTSLSEVLPSGNSPSRPKAAAGSRKKEAGGSGDRGMEGGVRRCTHCASEKTPQWRTGPLGPKTLCNACGVRYKSGRLVPEYRPAASPTFVLTHHSNSHRKVMELRRQKELLHRQAPAPPSPPPGVLFGGYEAC